MITLLALIIPTFVLADEIYEVGFRTTNCQQAPDYMYWYDINNNNSILYDYAINNQFLLGFCNNDPITPVVTGCCIGSLLLSASYNYQAISLVDLDVAGGLTVALPAVANGAKYCHVTSSTPNSASIFGFDEAAYLLGGGCNFGVSCSSNGTLSVYPDSVCASTTGVVSFQLYADRSTSLNVNGVSMIGSLWTVSQATSKYIWLTAFTTRLEVPTFAVSLDVISIIAGLVGIIIPSILVQQFWMRANRTTNRIHRKKFLVILLSQVGWIIYMILGICYWMIQYPTNISWQLVLEFQFILFNLLTLLCTYWTLEAILKFFKSKSLRKKRIWFGAILLLHLGTAGGSYIQIGLYYPLTAAFTNYWILAYPFWSLFVFIFDSIPPLGMGYRIAYLISFMMQVREVQNTKPMDTPTRNEPSVPVGPEPFYIEILARKHPRLVASLFGQLGITILYACFSYMDNYSSTLGGDQNFEDFQVVLSLCCVIHQALNISLAMQLETIANGLITDSAANIDQGPMNSRFTQKDAIVQKKTSAQRLEHAAGTSLISGR